MDNHTLFYSNFRILDEDFEGNSSTIKEIENKVKDITSKNITLVNKIDSSIVGGFVLRVGDLQPFTCSTLILLSTLLSNDKSLFNILGFFDVIIVKSTL